MKPLMIEIEKQDLLLAINGRPVMTMFDVDRRLRLARLPVFAIFYAPFAFRNSDFRDTLTVTLATIKRVHSGCIEDVNTPTNATRNAL